MTDDITNRANVEAWEGTSVQVFIAWPPALEFLQPLTLEFAEWWEKHDSRMLSRLWSDMQAATHIRITESLGGGKYRCDELELAWDTWVETVDAEPVSLLPEAILTAEWLAGFQWHRNLRREEFWAGYYHERQAAK